MLLDGAVGLAGDLAVDVAGAGQHGDAALGVAEGVGFLDGVGAHLGHVGAGFGLAAIRRREAPQPGVLD
ncbi:hypothetical protein [Kutzneria buriramensis]|uniref:hypothetical protein n=1 Tax=Kutzneria buriramensis TaxID=1045776 RepID=UPI000E263B1F